MAGAGEDAGVSSGVEGIFFDEEGGGVAGELDAVGGMEGD